MTQGPRRAPHGTRHHWYSVCPTGCVVTPCGQPAVKPGGQAGGVRRVRSSGPAFPAPRRAQERHTLAPAARPAAGGHGVPRVHPQGAPADVTAEPPASAHSDPPCAHVGDGRRTQLTVTGGDAKTRDGKGLSFKSRAPPRCQTCTGVGGTGEIKAQPLPSGGSQGQTGLHHNASCSSRC